MPLMLPLAGCDAAWAARAVQAIDAAGARPHATTRAAEDSVLWRAIPATRAAHAPLASH